MTGLCLVFSLVTYTFHMNDTRSSVLCLLLASMCVAPCCAHRACFTMHVTMCAVNACKCTAQLLTHCVWVVFGYHWHAWHASPVITWLLCPTYAPPVINQHMSAPLVTCSINHYVCLCVASVRCWVCACTMHAFSCGKHTPIICMPFLLGLYPI